MEFGLFFGSVECLGFFFFLFFLLFFPTVAGEPESTHLRIHQTLLKKSPNHRCQTVCGPTCCRARLLYPSSLLDWCICAVHLFAFATTLPLCWKLLLFVTTADCSSTPMCQRPLNFLFQLSWTPPHHCCHFLLCHVWPAPSLLQRHWLPLQQQLLHAPHFPKHDHTLSCLRRGGSFCVLINSCPSHTHTPSELLVVAAGLQLCFLKYSSTNHLPHRAVKYRMIVGVQLQWFGCSWVTVFAK